MSYSKQTPVGKKKHIGVDPSSCHVHESDSMRTPGTKLEGKKEQFCNVHQSIQKLDHPTPVGLSHQATATIGAVPSTARSI